MIAARQLFRTALTILGLAAALSTSAAELVLDVRARSIAPGEPVRLVITSSEPLESLAGQFLEQEVFLQPTGRDSGGDRWSGWTMVPLDAAAGHALVELSGETAAGRPVSFERLVRIESKQFPEERLVVNQKYVTPPPEVEARLARERARLAEIYARRSPLPPAPEPFVRPVPGRPTSTFGTRRFFNGEPRNPHPGLDLDADTGIEVLAAGAGEVVVARELYYSGNLVILDHGGGLFTLYAHLSKMLVVEGQRIEPAQVVGLVGATGRVTGPHLHWGAKIGSLPFDPTALLDEALFP
jgi:murein DD-endopeptidase MepM/ murein hydrolase activator NlpD